MDKEYRELLYGAMFDELDRVQAHRLYTDPELQKVALNLNPVISSLRRTGRGVASGLKNLAQDPRGFGRSLQYSYRKGSAGGGGLVGGLKNVWRTPAGKAAIVGGGALLGAGALMSRRREPQQQVVVAR